MKNILIGNNITKTFGEGTEKETILKDVKVNIKKGEFVSVMGPSGSGKSTLLYALSGMDTVDQGTIHFSDHELTAVKEADLSDIRRKQMGFVFQQPTFLKNLTIVDNIVLPAMRDNRKAAKKLTEKAKELLRQTGIEKLSDRMTSQVSGGQLQRAGICRAIINDPEIIFGDEPTGALNSKAAQEIMELFLQINRKGTTILLVTHDAKVAAQSERVLFMKDGVFVDELMLDKYEEVLLEERVQAVTERMNLAER